MIENGPPVLIDLAGRLLCGDLDLSASDDELCGDVFYSAAFVLMSADVEQGVSEEEARAAEKVLERLCKGWFTKSMRELVQVHFSARTLDSITNYFGSAVIDTRRDGKPHGALWTSSALPSGKACWEYLEGNEHSGSKRAQYVITPTSNAVLFEINRPEDYLFLLSEYPLIIDGRPVVDWGSASSHYSAVRLTVPGLATIEGLPLATENGTTCLQHWGVESTAWFTDDFTVSSRNSEGS